MAALANPLSAILHAGFHIGVACLLLMLPFRSGFPHFKGFCKIISQFLKKMREKLCYGWMIACFQIRVLGSAKAAAVQIDGENVYKLI